MIKPDVVLYEEGLDSNVIDRSIRAISEADTLIIGGTSWHTICILHILRIVEFATFHTVIAMDASMKFQHILTSGKLMKPINVLCDHRRKLPLLLHLRKFSMRRVRLCIQKHHLILIKL